MTQTEPEREKSLQDYRKKLVEHKEVESRLKESEYILRKL
jgi:26S proteasome regulatory subunit T4